MRLRTPVALLVALGLVVASCSDDGDDDTGETEAPTTTAAETAPSTTPATTVPPTTEEAPSVGSDEPTSPDNDSTATSTDPAEDPDAPSDQQQACLALALEARGVEPAGDPTAEDMVGVFEAMDECGIDLAMVSGMQEAFGPDVTAADLACLFGGFDDELSDAFLSGGDPAPSALAGLIEGFVGCGLSLGSLPGVGDAFPGADPVQVDCLVKALDSPTLEQLIVDSDPTVETATDLFTAVRDCDLGATLVGDPGVDDDAARCVFSEIPPDVLARVFVADENDLPIDPADLAIVEGAEEFCGIDATRVLT